MTEQQSDKTLFNLIAEEDTVAFSQLYERYRHPLFIASLKFTKSASASEEILQNIFITVWVKRVTLVDVERPDAWLYRILKNETIDYLRKEGTREKHIRNVLQFRTNAEGINNTLDTVESREYKRLLDRAVTELSEMQQLVWNMRFRDGRSLDEIAAELGIAKNTVRAHMRRATDRVRVYLKDAMLVLAILSSVAESV